ncbi:unnamed protein product [Adineta steineri]|uniref:Uncharacterized protein n=1 Tax=Adineta steineri TaxID=433720 RepID=A0A815C5Z8_9BILA|nr:unnamed protein product [Adineta steineri]CAF1279030.1 unnamed protein product [Adineta steineri]
MIFILFICFYLNNQVLASLIFCPVTTTTTVTSTRYSMTLSSPGIMSYSGTLLLSSNGNFIALITIPDSGSPQSAIQGTWSSSACATSMTLNAHNLYFLDLPKLSINNLTCTYTCGTNSDVLRTCTVVYKLKRLQATGTYSVILDLSIPKETND